jgi:hypothetical protein
MRAGHDRFHPAVLFRDAPFAAILFQSAILPSQPLAERIMFASRRAFLGTSLAGFAAPNILTANAAQREDKEEIVASADSTLFLTWRRDPTTTMMVQWIGERDELPETRVYYRAMPAAQSGLGGLLAALDDRPWTPAGPTGSHDYPKSDFKVFRTELTGLTPDTDYQFRVGKDGRVRRFRTMPARATDTISFISGGDAGVNAHVIANNIQAAKQDPAFAVIGGDLAYENGRTMSTHLAFVKNYSQYMIAPNGRLIPMLACLGNHEVDGSYNKDRDKAPFFYALFDALFADTSYATLDFGQYLSLVLLDTGHTSKIGGDQADWLDKILKARRDHPNTIVVNHVPAYPSARSMGTAEKPGTGADNRKYWVPLFEKYRVPVVLEHHDHTFKRSKLLLGGLEHDNGILYLGDGSWGKLRTPQPPEKLHHLVKVTKDYHLTLHRIQGDERFHLALDENGKVMDVTRTGQRKAGIVPAETGAS